MKAMLICPSERPGVACLAQRGPLAAIPLLGQSPLEYWLSHLACAGAKSVTVLAHDRPDQVRAQAGNGARWGLEVQVVEESRELTAAEVLLKYRTGPGAAIAQSEISVLDHFPGLAARPLFNSYQELFAASLEWMPHALGPDRVGMRQVRPGIWIGSRSSISPKAAIHAPCWIGRHVFVGAGAELGPQTILEDGAFIEGHAVIGSSCIGPDTFVGRYNQIINSIACGSILIDWKTNSSTEVPDPFLLCALRQPRERRTTGWFARLVQQYSDHKAEADVFWKDLLLNKEG